MHTRTRDKVNYCRGNLLKKMCMLDMFTVTLKEISHTIADIFYERGCDSLCMAYRRQRKGRTVEW